MSWNIDGVGSPEECKQKIQNTERLPPEIKNAMYTIIDCLPMRPRIEFTTYGHVDELHGNVSIIVKTVTGGD
jgi:hypothetical protein